MKSLIITAKQAMAALIGAAMLLATGACSNDGCSDNRSSIPLAGFYSAATGQAIRLDSIAIGGYGAPGDSLIMSEGTSATKVYLPLRSTATEVTYYIDYLQHDLQQMAIHDDVTLRYESIAWFESEQCGAMWRYRITSVSHTRAVLDSVAITSPDSLITNIDRESIRLYFRTSEQ